MLLITGFNLTRIFNLSHRICKCTFYLADYVCNIIQYNVGISREGKETLWHHLYEPHDESHEEYNKIVNTIFVNNTAIEMYHVHGTFFTCSGDIPRAAWACPLRQSASGPGAPPAGDQGALASQCQVSRADTWTTACTNHQLLQLWTSSVCKTYRIDKWIISIDRVSI